MIIIYCQFRQPILFALSLNSNSNSNIGILYYHFAAIPYYLYQSNQNTYKLLTQQMKKNHNRDIDQWDEDDAPGYSENSSDFQRLFNNSSSKKQDSKMSKVSSNKLKRREMKEFNQSEEEQEQQNSEEVDYQDVSSSEEEYKQSSRPSSNSRGRGRARGRGRGRGGGGGLKKNSRDLLSDFDFDSKSIPRNKKPFSKDSQMSSSKEKSQIYMQSEDEASETESKNFSMGFDDDYEQQEGMRMDTQSNINNQNFDDDQDSLEREKKYMYSQIKQQSEHSKSKHEMIFRSDSEDEDGYQFGDIDDSRRFADSRSVKKYGNSQSVQLKLEESKNAFNQLWQGQGKQNEEVEEKKQMTEQEKLELEQKKKKIRKYADNFDEYKIRRVMKYVNGKLDCNVRYLHELVYDCYTEDLICQQLMLAIKNMGLGNSLQFIKKYKQEKLSQFDFKKVKFTIFDHRRIVKLLKEKGTKFSYTDEKELYFMPYQMHVFLNQVYALPQDAYEALCASIDQAYQLTWWKTIGTQLKGKQIAEEVKQGQANNNNNNTNNNNAITNNSNVLKKKSQPKRIKYKLKLGDNDDGGEEKKLDDKIELESNCLRKQEQPIKRDFENDNISVFESSMAVESKRQRQKQSFFSSSIFDTEKYLDSDFSMDSNTHSLQNVSDLFSDLGLQSSYSRSRFQSKNTKEELQRNQMQKVKKTSQLLSKVQQSYKRTGKGRELMELRRSKRQRKQENKQEKRVKKEEEQQQEESQQMEQESSRKPNNSVNIARRTRSRRGDSHEDSSQRRSISYKQPSSSNSNQS